MKALALTRKLFIKQHIVKHFNIFKVNFFTFCQNNDLEVQTISNETRDMEIFNKKEPEEYRTIYLENLNPEWTEEEVRVRLEQLGEIEKLHLVKNKIGESTGKVIAVYSKIDQLVQALNLFKDKYPYDKPIKIRFYRKFENNKQKMLDNLVLLIKNVPQELPKDDLRLFISEFAEPLHIAYPRDEQNNFKKMAYVYFKNQSDAETVFKYANLRYVMKKQLFISYATNYLDISDFRTRLELNVKIEDPNIEMLFFQKQINNLLQSFEENKHKIKIPKEEFEKLEYLKYRYRTLEHQIGSYGLYKNENKLIEQQNNEEEKLIENIKTRGPLVKHDIKKIYKSFNKL